MIQCKDCEFFQTGPDGRPHFSCDPFSTIHRLSGRERVSVIVGAAWPAARRRSPVLADILEGGRQLDARTAFVPLIMRVRTRVELAWPP